MPPKVLPDGDGINRIFDELTQRKFYAVQGLQHFRGSTKDEYAILPRARSGAELGFVFRKDDLSVVVWTTWLRASGNARNHDCGWIVIEEAGKGKYFLPIYRTKGFVDHFIIEAQIARCRVRTRPTCPVCKARMEIARGKGIGSRYWRCPLRHARESWDHEAFLSVLPPFAKKHLSRRRRQRWAWYEKCREAGKPIRQAVFLRRAWRRSAYPVSGSSF